jgi:hypothetical protein
LLVIGTLASAIPLRPRQNKNPSELLPRGL